MLFRWFWEASGDLWGVSRGLLGTPGGLWERLRGTLGTKCTKKTSQIPERAAQVPGAPKRWPGEPKKPSDGREKEAKRRVNETLNTTKVSEKEK